MVVLGLLLILLGGLAIVSAVFALDLDNGTISYLSLDVSPLALFLIGVVATLAVVVGAAVLKWGSKRSWARRREQKLLDELNDRLDEADARRRHDGDRDTDRS